MKNKCIVVGVTAGIAAYKICQLVSSLKKLYNNIVCYKIQTPPPPRICYQLTHRYPKPSLIETINRFEDELLCFINSNTNICRFEPWMLEIEK